jgi:hypothetical protein
MRFHFAILAIVLCTIGLSVKAQTLSVENDILEWQVDNLYDTAANVTSAFTCQFITYPDSKIAWVQKDNYTIEFNIRSTEGNWDDPDQAGSMEYSVKYEDKKGKIRISRSVDGIQIRMFFMEDDKNTMPYVFHVTALTKKS